MNPQVSTSWDRTPSQRAQPQGRHGAQGTWMVISEVCNSSWNWCCSKGQMDLIKYFHFKTLEFFYLAFSNWLFLIKKKNSIPGKFLVFQLSTQVKWKMQAERFDARWPFGLGDSLINYLPKNQKTPSMQEGCYPVCLWTSAEATFFFLATWSLDGFPKDQERVGLTVVENIWNRSQEWKNKNTSSSN